MVYLYNNCNTSAYSLPTYYIYRKSYSLHFCYYYFVPTSIPVKIALPEFISLSSIQNRSLLLIIPQNIITIIYFSANFTKSIINTSPHQRNIFHYSTTHFHFRKIRIWPICSAPTPISVFLPERQFICSNSYSTPTSTSLFPEEFIIFSKINVTPLPFIF